MRRAIARSTNMVAIAGVQSTEQSGDFYKKKKKATKQIELARICFVI
ncbi:MAG: hypothetical protein ACI4F9_06920 [Lachnospiraceae bacterium]